MGFLTLATRVSLSWALNLSEQLIPHLQQLDDGANLKGLL